MGDEQARNLEALRRALGFTALGDDELQRMASACSTFSLPAGEVLFEKGSEPDALFVVLSGAVRIFDVIQGNERDIAVIGPGDFTGEVSLALNTTRTRSAMAREASEILRVPAESFHALASRHPTLGSQLIEGFEERMAAREAAAEGDG